MKDYTPKIPKAELKHGAYYKGSCRNASVARWSVVDNCFFHFRTKFGHTFIETISCPEDEHVYDVFIAEREIDLSNETVTEIPLRE